MPLTILNAPGDNSYMSTINLADSGTQVMVAGSLNPNSTNPVAFSNTSLTSPTPPTTGFIYWLIEVNTTTGALDVIQSAASFPANTTNCITIFQQTLAPGQANPALVPTDATPDV